MTATPTLIQPAQLSYRINLAKSYRLLENKIEEHNLKHQGIASMQIKAPQRALAEKMIRLYKDRINRWQYECMGMVEGLSLPTLSLNNKFLGRIMSVTDRTIKNYRNRLKSLGLIVKSHFYGSGKPFEVQFSTDFLFFEQRNEQGYWQALQNFPLTSTSTSSGTFTGTVTGTLLEESSSNGKAFELEPSPKAAQEQQNAEGQERSPFKQPERPPVLDNRNEEGSQGQAFQAVTQQYASALWVEAKKRLWPGKYFSPNEEKAAQNALEQCFALGPMERFARFYEIALFRIGLAQLYWEREFGAPPPHPSEFFNPKNKNGFSATKHWPKDEAKYPVKPISYKQKRKLQTRSSLRSGDVNRIGNLFN